MISRACDDEIGPEQELDDLLANGGRVRTGVRHTGQDTADRNRVERMTQAVPLRPRASAHV